MSAGADVAALVPASGTRARVSREGTAPIYRPQRRLAAFAALGFYGAIRWQVLLIPAPGGRLLEMLMLAIALAAVGTWLGPRRRTLTIILAALAIVAVFALSGVPVRWIVHLRLARTADGIGQGLSAMPGALVPYTGLNDWLRVVIIAGGGVLLMSSAAILALAPRPLSDLWRAMAAVPLVALATVPATLVHPQLPYLQGLVLFALLAAFMWSERIPTGDGPMVTMLAAIAVIAAMIIAPRLDPGSPWFNYLGLASKLAPGHVDTFDWSQRYGPLHWPRSATEVLDVKAGVPDYWKAEDLDQFDGRGWVASKLASGDAQGTITAANRSRWTQTIKVTIQAMRTNDVIAAGFSAAPRHTPGILGPGSASGTWKTSAPLGPGASYTVRVYSPHPSTAQLETAGTNYPSALLPGFLTVEVPVAAHSGSSTPVQPVLFPPFGVSPQGAYGPTTDPPGPAMAASPYARTYALARTLARRSATPYDYVTNVEHYLTTPRFRYDESPKPHPYPLESFLFKARAGYCQQFAGAMALLLRMGGVPARVATGFTPGTPDSQTKQWVVDDLDAHAWVEAWFPGYGWVRFDPTPTVAPARGGHIALPVVKGQGESPAARSGRAPRRAADAGPAGAKPRHRPGSGSDALVILALAVALVVLVLIGRTALVMREPRAEQMLAELERALQRSGQPIAPSTTLATLEQRFRGTPGAAAYVRRLRLARFAATDGLPTRAERRALREELGVGLGLAGRLRALWALPPQLVVHRGVPHRSAAGINSE